MFETKWKRCRNVFFFWICHKTFFKLIDGFFWICRKTFFKLLDGSQNLNSIIQPKKKVIKNKNISSILEINTSVFDIINPCSYQ